MRAIEGTQLRIRHCAAVAMSAIVLTGSITGVSAANIVPAAATSQTALTISVLSNRADLVSGGDALVELSEPAKVKVGDRDVSDAFALRADGRVTGVLTGLALGRNVVTAVTRGGRTSRLEITNHPSSGPVFSGPQIRPWVYQPTSNDPGCAEPAKFELLYKPLGLPQSELKPYDPAKPPLDMSMTTTDQGVTVPFIVRRETGYINRGAYTIMTLFQPGSPWEATAPQRQWNRKTLITGGSSCGNAHDTGTAPFDEVLNSPLRPLTWQLALSRGFAVMSSALANTGHSCNPVINAESLMMVKEHLQDRYGDIRYTIGQGCSGGSLVQMWVANAYPGIYDGITPACTYTDVHSTLMEFGDYHQLRHYFEDPTQWAPGVVWTPAQMAAVAGHASYTNVVVGDELFIEPILDPQYACPGVSAEQRYEPSTRPAGVRCSLFDYNINALGPRSPSVWTDNESEIGHGFGASTYDNVGVQYGLSALRSGLITPEMFVDLNERFGSFDIDLGQQSARAAADPVTIANAFRSGNVNVTSNLDQTAIINGTGFEPTIAHDVSHAYWARYRLDREHGDHDNHVMWQGPVPGIGTQSFYNDAFLAMDRWLAAVEQDTTDRSIADKVAANRPADVHDKCTLLSGVELTGECPEPLRSEYGTPRTVADMPETADTMKCHLKPLSRDDDYGIVPFTDAQWNRLEQVFTTGVCDYSRPSISQQDTVPWATYGSATVNIFGGQALPAAPTSY